MNSPPLLARTDSIQVIPSPQAIVSVIVEAFGLGSVKFAENWESGDPGVLVMPRMAAFVRKSSSMGQRVCWELLTLAGEPVTRKLSIPLTDAQVLGLIVHKQLGGRDRDNVARVSRVNERIVGRVPPV